MPRFFIDRNEIKDGRVTLTGEDARHISRALRMAVGDALVLSDGEGNELSCRLVAFTDETVTAEILHEAPSENESPIEVHLYQGYPKGDKLETVIEKAVELGVTTVTPFLSSFVVKRPQAEKGEKLLARHNKIAAAAAQQCGRARLPQVLPTLPFDAMLRDALSRGPVLFCYEGGGTTPLPAVLHALPVGTRALSIIIGSEGGFSGKEAEAAVAAGAIPTGLGKRILRAETAPLLVLSAISYAFEL